MTYTWQNIQMKESYVNTVPIYTRIHFDVINTDANLLT